jgi:hypothetical protein
MVISNRFVVTSANEARRLSGRRRRCAAEPSARLLENERDRRFARRFE